MEPNAEMFRASSSPQGVGPSSPSSSSLTSSSSSRRYGILTPSNIIQAPLSVLLEYFGILPSHPNHHHNQPNPDAVVPNDSEVSISIIGPVEHKLQREEQPPPSAGLVFRLLHSQNGIQHANGRDSSYKRYDIQHAARWIEQVLPFSLLLFVVFIWQHL